MPNDPTNDLPKLTPSRVREWAEEFDRDETFGTSDRALTWLFKKIPRNVDRELVLLKVVALNRLYSTQVYAVVELAEHIVAKAIDPLLQQGKEAAVDAVAHFAHQGKTRRLYSFASKYCSWHRPETYPILDSQVKDVLWKYEKRDGLCRFKRSELDTYGGFSGAHRCFVEAYGLASLDLKTLDKGLWMLGRRI